MEKPLYGNSSLESRVRVDKICQDCELEISGILLMMDLRVVDISDFDVIIGIKSFWMINVNTIYILISYTIIYGSLIIPNIHFQMQ